MQRIRNLLGRRGTLPLMTVAILEIAAPLMFVVANATPSQAQSQNQSAAAPATVFEYEVASIKPSKPDAVGGAHRQLRFQFDLDAR
jgi:hypothetical protein